MGTSLAGQSRQGQVAADGTLSLTFPATPSSGQTWTFTISIAGAPPGSSWTAAVDGGAIDTWLGAGPAGPYQLGPGQQLALTATNCIPGTLLAAALNGSSDPSGQAPQVYPLPRPGPATVRTSTLLDHLTGGNNVTKNYTLDPSVRGLTVITYSDALVTVTGLTTNFRYANLLPGGPLLRIPLAPALDPTITITVSRVGVINTWVQADYDPTTFDIYPNTGGAATRPPANEAIWVATADPALITVPVNAGPFTVAGSPYLMTAIVPPVHTGLINTGPAGTYRGYSARENTETARARFRLLDPVGNVLETVALGPGESWSESYYPGAQMFGFFVGNQQAELVVDAGIIAADFTFRYGTA